MSAPSTTVSPPKAVTTAPPAAPTSAGPNHSADVAVPGGDETTTWGAASAPRTVTVWKWVRGESTWRRRAAVDLTVPAGVGFHPSVEGADVSGAPDAIFVVHADFGSSDQQAEVIGPLTHSWGQLVSDVRSPAMSVLIVGASVGEGAYLDAGFSAGGKHHLVTVTANPFFTGKLSRLFPLVESWKWSESSLRRAATTAVTAAAARDPGMTHQELPFGACDDGTNLDGGLWDVPGGLALAPVANRADLNEGAYTMTYPSVGRGAPCSQRLDDDFPTVIRVVGGSGWILVPLWVSVWVDQQTPRHGLDVPVPPEARSATSPLRLPSALGVTAFVQSDGPRWGAYTAMSGAIAELIRF